MGYELHIERFDAETEEPRPIPIAEWLAAVEATPGVRAFTGAELSATNPETGEVLSLRTRLGDVEVWLGDEWAFVFSWFHGRAKFGARGVAIGDVSDPIWAAALTSTRDQVARETSTIGVGASAGVGVRALNRH